MAYDDDILTGAGSDGGSSGSNVGSAPQVILSATRPKPRKPLSAGSAQNKTGAAAFLDATTLPVKSDSDSDSDVPRIYGGSIPWPGPSVDPDLSKPDTEGMPSISSVSSSKGTPADAGATPSAQNTSSAGVGAPTVQAGAPTLPTLAPQVKNPVLRVLGRLTGMTRPTPEPGQPYTGPISTESKIGTLGRFLGRVGDASTMSFGSTAQKQALLEQRQIDATRLAHLAQLAETARWHDMTENIGQQNVDVAQQRADTARQQTQAGARSKGLILGDDGSIRPMTPEEILNDPILSQNYDLKRTAMNVQNFRGALYEAQRAALTDPNNPMLQAKLQRLQQEMRFHQDQMGLALARLQQGAQGLDLRSREAGLKQYQPALDAQRQLSTMRENYRDALNGDQQAMVSLLMNHIGMTLGAQKGARITKDSIREAERSRGLISGASSILNFDGDGNLRWDDPVRAGITLTPEQMKQMLNLGEGMFRNKVSESRSGAQYLGISAEPEWDVDPDSPIPNYGSVAPPAPIIHAATPRRNQGGGSSGTKVLSLAQIQQAAKDHGVSVDEAKRQALAQGYQVK